MNASEYKKYHESFMQNNHGSTALHTYLCIFFTVQCAIYSALTKRSSDSLQCFIEYIVIVLPLILAHTILSKHIFLLNVILAVMLLVKLRSLNRDNICKKFKLANSFNAKYISSISILRALTYLITVCCILAVDFKAFPRHLAKTEKFGYSLMDTGVGLFVLMSGLVHKDLSNFTFIRILQSNVKFVCVLVTLGVSRFVMVRQLDYQEHVTEYGVHWNFFFTLAVCKVLSTLFLSLTSHSLYLSMVVMAFHELLLFYGLQDWVFSDVARANLLTANREGISSSLGYVALYIFAVHVKQILSNKSLIRYQVLMKLALLSSFLFILMYLYDYFRVTSRTLANAGYCIYLAETLVSILFVMYGIEVLCNSKDKNYTFDIPDILIAVNNNGLIYFLIANLLTGLINLSMRTMLLSTTSAIIILNCYMILTILIVVSLKSRDIRI